METYTRVADFDGDLGNLARTFCDTAFEFPIGREDVRKFCMKSGEYMVVVSNNKPSYEANYNFILTVTGPDIMQAHRIAMNFQEKTGFRTRPAPPRLSKQMALMGIVPTILRYMMQDPYFQKTF